MSYNIAIRAIITAIFYEKCSLFLSFSVAMFIKNTKLNTCFIQIVSSLQKENCSAQSSKDYGSDISKRRHIVTYNVRPVFNAGCFIKFTDGSKLLSVVINGKYFSNK